MYDWPEVQDRTDAFWSAVRLALPADLNAPDKLSRPEDLSAPWRSTDLLLGQTCGLPYVSGSCGDAVVVGRPVYRVSGAGDGRYSSALIARVGEGATLADFRSARAAVNEPGSQSGHNALLDATLEHADGDFFGEVVWSGAHRRSACMVSDGVADVAAIDAVAWALFAEVDPDRHAKLQILGWTRPMPALPFITALANAARIPDLRAALQAAAAAARGTNIPDDVLPATDADYDPVREMARRIAGYRLAPTSPAAPAL
ncbi:MAG: PhnD/SsuA/transferrin family substrate-binding protein [Pseudomonadota bacterium]